MSGEGPCQWERFREHMPAVTRYSVMNVTAVCEGHQSAMARHGKHDNNVIGEQRAYLRGACRGSKALAMDGKEI